jgi:hypothetical protein
MFPSFYVAHLAQPNESSRRRVVAVIKNDWAQPNPKWFKTSTNRPCPKGETDYTHLWMLYSGIESERFM